MDTVGFIGLGNLGSAMAGNIQKAGYPLVVYDTRPEAAGVQVRAPEVDPERVARFISTHPEVDRDR